MAVVNTPKRVKKFKVIPVDIDVEYIKPIRGRLFAVFAWLYLAQFKIINYAPLGKPIFTWYCIIYPRFKRIK